MPPHQVVKFTTGVTLDEKQATALLLLLGETAIRFPTSEMDAAAASQQQSNAEEPCACRACSPQTQNEMQKSDQNDDDTPAPQEDQPASRGVAAGSGGAEATGIQG